MKGTFSFKHQGRIFLTLCILSLNIACNSPKSIGGRGVEIEEEEPVFRGKTFAVIIGISNYDRVSDLQYAHRDAVAFSNFLKSASGGQLPPENIFTLLDEHATKINVANALSQVVQTARKGDRIYLFFAGHGDMEVQKQKENGLLLLHNSPNGNYFGIIDDVLEIAQLRDYLQPVSQRGIEILYIIDACHSGNLSGGSEGKQQTAAALLSTWGQEYKIMSCQPNQLSLESESWGGGRGLFSYKFEEALNGGADKNKDGVITMLELYTFLLEQVAAESKNKQIPLITGDLSKTIIFPENKSSDNLPETGLSNNIGLVAPDNAAYTNAFQQQLIQSFQRKLEKKKLIYPFESNALLDYKTMDSVYPNHVSLPYMKRLLIDSLQVRFSEIVSPMLMGSTSVSTMDACYYAAAELDTCLTLLGPDHFLYSNIKARKLYMDAMALTWALYETEFNSTWKEKVEAALKFLEESYSLEPNAAYTSLALGERYTFIADFDKAEFYFRNYLSLRPKDYYAIMLLGDLYVKIQRYDKAEVLYTQLSEKYPNTLYYWKTADAMIYNGKFRNAMLEIDKILTIRDTFSYFFCRGLAFGKMYMTDSSIQCYHQALEKYGPWTPCYNNIGYMYLISNRLDSSAHYFSKAQKTKPESALPYFNLGTIATLQHDFENAVRNFRLCLERTNERDDCFVSRTELYHNKQYHFSDSGLYKTFTERVYSFKIQYVTYLSLLYCVLRDAEQASSDETVTQIFDELFKFKQFDALTWYHHACWRALQQDRAGALESLEKSLKLGFGNYFQITADQDLHYVRSTAKYQELIKKYFQR